MYKNVISVLLLISTVSATAMEKDEPSKDLQPRLKKKKIEDESALKLVVQSSGKNWNCLPRELQLHILQEGRVFDAMQNMRENNFKDPFINVGARATPPFEQIVSMSFSQDGKWLAYITAGQSWGRLIRMVDTEDNWCINISSRNLGTQLPCILIKHKSHLPIVWEDYILMIMKCVRRDWMAMMVMNVTR